MKIKPNKKSNVSRRYSFTKKFMLICIFSSLFAFNTNAQCIQNIQNGIDCCDFRIEVFNHGVSIGFIGQATPSICSDACNVPPGTTSSPYTGTIQLNVGSSCGPAQSMATYCTNNPGANISFVITKLAQSPPSWSVTIPTNGTKVTFSEASCCGVGQHYAKVSGTTLILWYDCP